MAPPIRYARTSDGVSIAYADLGSGPPVVCMPPVPFSHVEEGWRLPGQRRWFERLARSARVVLYDARGTGLSDREGAPAGDCSIEAMSRDLEAVTEALGFERFALVGFFNASPPAVAYAAAHPARVSQLVLWGGFARGTDLYPLAPAIPSDARLLEAQWQALAETAARSWTAAGDAARDTASYFRACVSAAGALRYGIAARGWDVTSLLPTIEAPTLVVQRRDTASQNPEVARRLAAAIPGAQLAFLPGEAASPFSGDVDAGVDEVVRFLGLGAATPEAPGAFQPPPLPDAVTAREVEVLALLARGLANKEIAGRLQVSINTVERHLTNLYPKIGARSRTEATAFAIRHGLG